MSQPLIPGTVLTFQSGKVLKFTDNILNGESIYYQFSDKVSALIVNQSEFDLMMAENPVLTVTDIPNPPLDLKIVALIRHRDVYLIEFRNGRCYLPCVVVNPADLSGTNINPKNMLVAKFAGHGLKIGLLPDPITTVESMDREIIQVYHGHFVEDPGTVLNLNDDGVQYLWLSVDGCYQHLPYEYENLFELLP